MEYLNKEEFVFREHVGDVEENEHGVKGISRTMTSAPVIEFDDGTKVLYSCNWLITRAVELK